MDDTRKKTHPSLLNRNGPGPEAASADAPQEGEMLGQARRWARVAREAYQSASRGAEAELELQRRRNSSGQ